MSYQYTGDAFAGGSSESEDCSSQSSNTEDDTESSTESSSSSSSDQSESSSKTKSSKKSAHSISTSSSFKTSARSSTPASLPKLQKTSENTIPSSRKFNTTIDKYIRNFNPEVSSSSSGDEEVLTCNCNLEVKTLTVHRDGPNKGRRFFTCPQGVEKGCEFFLWETVQEDGQEQASFEQDQFNPKPQTSNVLSEFQLQTQASSSGAEVSQDHGNVEDPKSKPQDPVVTNQKRYNWSLDELNHLIEICAEHKVLLKSELQPKKNVSLYNSIQVFLVKKNYSRSVNQIYTKIKQLKEDFQLLRSKQGSELQQTISKKPHFQYLYNTVVKSSEKPELSSATEVEEEHSESVDLTTEFVNESIFWTEAEIRDLLTLCIERNLFGYKDSKAIKNREIYEHIHRELQKMGSQKSYEQMTNKLSALRADHSKIEKELAKSGAAGMDKVLAKKPYYPKMVELFGQRPKSTMEGVDSIDLKTLLDVSIDQDNESKRRFPKPASTKLDGLLSKTIESAKQDNKLLAETCLKQDKEIAMENRECFKTAIKESTEIIVSALKELVQNRVMSSNLPSTSHSMTHGTQFPTYPMAAQHHMTSGMTPYGDPSMNMFPGRISEENSDPRNRSGEKRKKKKNHKNIKSKRRGDSSFS